MAAGDSFASSYPFFSGVVPKPPIFSGERRQRPASQQRSSKATGTAAASSTKTTSIRQDGTLTNKRMFSQSGLDGIALDEKGYLYVTSGAVLVYEPSGSRIETIQMPERPSNVCFDGAGRKTLFITARKSLHAVDMRVRGQ